MPRVRTARSEQVRHTYPSGQLQGRVDPAIKERAGRGAATRAVSIARYLEILIEGDEVADSYVEPGSCEQLDLGVSA